MNVSMMLLARNAARTMTAVAPAIYVVLDSTVYF